jgi:cell division protein FtsB
MTRLGAFWLFLRRRKYLITLLVFAVIVGFLDDNSLARRFDNAREAARLTNEIEHYRAEYDRATEQLNALAVDSSAIERVAREKYFMKRPNEDIFIFKGDRRK